MAGNFWPNEVKGKMFFRVLTRLQAVEKLTGLEEAGKQWQDMKIYTCLKKEKWIKKTGQGYELKG